MPPDGSIAPDGYAPIPAWLGQTRAPRPVRSEAYAVETVASGLAGAFAFHFLPDGRIIVSERPGRIRIVGKDGKPSEPLAGLPAIWNRGPQGLFEVLPDCDFARNRVIYLTYTALPEGTNPASPPRLAGVLMVARARLSDDSTRLEDVKTILDAEGIGGRAIQASDGTLLVASSIPAGVGIDSVDWPQPQQLDSLMGKVLRINTDGSIPKDNPFVGRANARPEIYALGIRDDQGMALHPRTGAPVGERARPARRRRDQRDRERQELRVSRPSATATSTPASRFTATARRRRAWNSRSTSGRRTSRPPASRSTPDASFPGWRDNLFVCALAGKHLVRLVLQGNRVVAEERLLTELDARLRDVHEGPDGALYVMTDGNEGRILRLTAKR